MKNHLILGNWNALCDSCGRKFKALDLQKRWDGLMVCKEDWEMRHPSDFLRVQKEKINVEFSRPYPAQDTYLPENLWINTQDDLGFTEEQTFDFNRHLSESIGITEVFDADIGQALTYSSTESISTSETVRKTPGKKFTESVSLSESLYFTEAEHNVESMTFTELSAFATNKRVSENMSLAETKVLLTNKGISETVSVTESVSSSLLIGSTLNGAALNINTLG